MLINSFIHIKTLVQAHGIRVNTIFFVQHLCSIEYSLSVHILCGDPVRCTSWSKLMTSHLTSVPLFNWAKGSFINDLKEC